MSIELSDIKLMSEEIQPLGEHNPRCECVRTDSFPLLKQDFEYYNPMQSKFLTVLSEANWEGNVVVSSPTASGKTTVAEIAMAVANHKGKKGIVLVPLKALAQEKFDDWTSLNHTFFDRNVVILTGDYAQNVSEDTLNNADIVIMTSEALDHRSRFMSKNPWLMDVGMAVVDEAHLLTLQDRGDRLETCLMRLVKYNKDAKISLLSATMPNVKDLKVWLDNITGANTIMVQSNYRPCKLTRNYVRYEESPWRKDSWDKNEKLRMSLCVDTIVEYKDDQWIVFAGGKKWGRDALQFFRDSGYVSEFISADDNLQDRLRKVEGFKNGTIRVLLATSVLAYGLNLPARRVLIPHVRRGKMNIATCDLLQMEGRSGRPRYDKEGTAFYLIPNDDFYPQKKRIEKGENIVSQLVDEKNLLFHVVAEVYNQEIIDAETFRDWYSRSLACVQNGVISLSGAQGVLDTLEKINVIRKDEKGNYSVTNLGKVACWYYQSPFDVFRWYLNFKTLFVEQNGKFNDADIAWAITNTDTWSGDYVSLAEKLSCTEFVRSIKDKHEFRGGVEKWGACVYNMLRGVPNITLKSNESNINYDLERLVGTLNSIDQMYGQWGQSKFFDVLKMRLKYKIKQDMVDVVRIKWVGGKVAEQLFAKGVRSVKDFVNPNNVVNVKAVMGTRYTEAMQSAKELG